MLPCCGQFSGKKNTDKHDLFKTVSFLLFMYSVLEVKVIFALIEVILCHEKMDG